MQKCYHCQYWKSKGDNGECHRFPKHSGQSFLSDWAITKSSDWCGEFMRKVTNNVKRGKKNVKADIN